jgi:hypothetical protein
MTGKCLPKVPNSPFAPIVPLFIEPVDSDLFCFLEEVHILIQQTPALLEAVEKDLDTHALGKKADRIAEAQWYDKRSLPLRGILDPPQDPEQPLALKMGRPRTPAYVVLVALFLRGYSGSGFKAADVTSFMLESITLRVFFTNLGLPMPGRSTFTELVNAVRNETRSLVLDAQLARALQLKLDDFKTIFQDSTHVAGNTAWPTDSRLMVDLVARLIRVGELLGRVQLAPIDSGMIRQLLAQMVRLNREIDFSQGKKDGQRIRTRCYKKLLRISKRIHSLLVTTHPSIPCSGKVSRRCRRHFL